MGIFGALSTAVAGMQAQSFALQNISGNIANSQTVAYKRTDTSFADMIQDAQPARQVAGSVMASSRGTNTVQGDIQGSSVGTFMAVNGEGYFAVMKPTSVVDNNAVFSGVNQYTRRGDFQPNKDGYLVNGAGYYLMGLKVDPASGNVTGSVPEVMRISNDFLEAQRTSLIDYRANLPQVPFTKTYNPKVANSELLNPADYAAIATGVTGAESGTFIEQSVGGGAVTAYNETGVAVSLQLRWAKTDSAANGGTDTWNLFYQVNTNPGAADPAWVNVGTDFTFGADGKMTNSPPVESLDLTGVTVDNVVLGDVKVRFGSGGLTQYADANGTVQVNAIQQNGYAAGALQSVSVNEKGRVVGSYSNGRSIDLYEVSLANFSGPNYLKKLDGGAFEATDGSGPPIYGNAGGIVGGSLESSNTDIADEFTKLIVTQQAYSANTRVISTSNDMVQSLLSMLR
ncbi:Flagellar hook protein FlgE [Rhodovulum sp. PH10]|uniref:flagellar hook protein FlgE n=1 Tax=Rhodovulum sp. PH10 TaxID=1187851 RepID=UPI00027C20C9|nr:flagellar hook-basal body complex protein [Rhodovulum sp. PH10]EJW09649.1 Flagellar hook protein FlgE [Rhodovulum sp. PH10]